MSEHLELHPENKRIAMLIAVLALVLAVCETLSKGYQTEVISKHIQSSDLWSFYQAKTIRQTATQLTIDTLKLSDRKELAERAQIAEHQREEASHRYHSLEIAVGMLQVAIVLASASVLTGMMALAWLSGGLGLTAAGIAAYATLIGGHLI